MFTPSVKESAGVRVLSLAEGDFLGKGDSIDFIIQTEDQSSTPELLEIELLAQSGLRVWNTSISSPLTDEELELVLPDLETGIYTILFTVHGEEAVVEEKRLEFFYTAGTYDILGVSSYPPTIMAGHETVIQADLLFPQGANPYIRWSWDDTVLAKGSLNDGLQSITWMAPEEEGVYSIRVEMFPVPPPTGTDFSFSSSLALTAQLYVSTASFITDDELVPEDSYYALFHLNGTLVNAGLLGETVEEAQIVGQAKLNNEKGIMGYQIGSGAGFHYPLNIIPIREGALSPCTITCKLLATSENKDRNLLMVSEDSGGFRLRIFFDSEEQLVATIDVQDTTLYLPSNIFGLGLEQHRRIDLSLIPLEEGLQALWFIDGLLTASLFEAPLPTDLSESGNTTVAGENGFSGIITELGVFFQDSLNRPSVDPGIYRAAMWQEHGRALVLAEGFEGLYLPDPDSWRLESAEAVSLQAGHLTLPASSALTLPYFELGTEDTSFLVEFFGQIPPGSTIALQWEEAESPFLTIDPTGQIVSAAEQSPQSKAFSPTGAALKLTLTQQDLILTTADEPISYTFQRPADRNTWLSITLQSPEEATELMIDTILIVQELKS